MARTVSFTEACQRFTNRYTMEHVPGWARQPMPNGKYYAPQFRSDREWYDNTLFKGEHEMADAKHCWTQKWTFPLGLFLETPFHKMKEVANV